MEDLIIFLVIFLISIIQSVFGVGILLFGTPTLIYLNYDFIETLNFLLPCSILVSLFQIFFVKKIIKKNSLVFKKNFFLYCLTCIFISLVVLSNIINEINFHKFIGLTLLIILSTKFFIKYFFNYGYYLKNYHKIINAIIGIIHGSTNMGGSFLSIYVAEISKKNIELRRYLIGYAYFFMAVTQLFSLLVTNNIVFTRTNIMCLFITLLCILLSFSFVHKINIEKYNFIFNSILLIYAFLLILN